MASNSERRRYVDQGSSLLEEWNTPGTEKFWKRNKKANVNLMHESALCLDRQLEDQHFLMMQNRNPRLAELTKADKVRSDKISAKKGGGNPLSTKAKVLSNIIREASGVHNYTLVASIHQRKSYNNKETPDADTHPLVKPYREQANRAPTMSSFGHRPLSASRTFNPGTMKVHLKKGEVVNPNPSGGNGFGLPPAVLSKILKAPKVLTDEEQLEQAALEESKKESLASLPDPHDLFSTIQSIDSHNADQIDIMSSLTERKALHKNRKHKTNKEKSTNSAYGNAEELEKSWNQTHHVIPFRPNLLFELRASGIAENSARSLSERLNRFKTISTLEGPRAQQNTFCSEKKYIDQCVINHEPVPRDLRDKLNPYHDPFQEHAIKEINELRQNQLEEQEKAYKKRMLKKSLKEIDYPEYNSLQPDNYLKKTNPLQKDYEMIKELQVTPKPELSKTASTKSVYLAIPLKAPLRPKDMSFKSKKGYDDNNDDFFNFIMDPSNPKHHNFKRQNESSSISPTIQVNQQNNNIHESDQKQKVVKPDKIILPALDDIVDENDNTNMQLGPAYGAYKEPSNDEMQNSADDLDEEKLYYNEDYKDEN